MNNKQVLPDVLTGAKAWWVAALIFVFPATALVVTKASSVTFGLLALTGILFAFLYPSRAPLLRDEKVLLFSMIFFFVVALLSYVFSDFTLGFSEVGLKKLGRYLRFLLFIPIYLVVRRIQHSEGIWWTGIATGATLAGVLGLFMVIGGDQPGLYSSRVGGVTNPILYGDISLTMAFMSLGGWHYFRERGKLWLIVPLLGFVLGNVAAILSGARGAWLAYPLFTLLLFMVVARQLTAGQRFGIAGGLIIFLFASYFIPQTGMSMRLDQLFTELGDAFHNKAGLGSIGLRLQMWTAAFHVFLEHPVLGAGVGGYIQGVKDLVDDGKMLDLFLRYNHPHNEYLLVLASRGLLGLISLILMFGVPLKHFLWAIRHSDPYIRHFAFAGIILITGYMHFALTEAIFDRTMPITFYAFSLAAIYGLLRARERHFLNTPAQRKKTLSVIIIAMDEADRIGPCLESIKGWADEIVVLDSGSADETAAIARRYTDKVFVTDWPGFGIQKQRALEKATCDWVLSLDADEVVSNELRNEIDSALTDRPAYDGYRIPRPIIVFGKQLDYGVSWQAPIRLCERQRSSFTDAPVHEKIVIPGGRITIMRGALFHETYRDYGHALEKYDQYAWLQASVRWSAGRRSSLVGAYLRATFNFFHNFIVKGGFLDGQHGFLMACLNAQYTFHKYAMLWAKKAEARS